MKFKVDFFEIDLEKLKSPTRIMQPGASEVGTEPKARPNALRGSGGKWS